MAKSESPPLQMVVEKGPRLAPATPADAERLDTWRFGSKVNITFVRNGSRPMERKWFAILGLVVNQCDVPWTTKETASEAVKLALGIVNYGKTVNGNFMQWPKSLTALTDPELDDAVRDMMDLIHEMTGVDPETLKKESADVGEDEPEPSTEPTDTAQPSGDPEAGTQSETVLSNPDEAGHGDAAVPASGPTDNKRLGSLMAECRDKMLALAVDTALSPQERRCAIEVAKDGWKLALPEDLPFVKACMEAADRVVKLGADRQEDERAFLDKLIDRVRK